MPKTPLRAIRIDDELWEAVMAKATEARSTVSQVIRDALVAYLKD